MSFEKFVPPKKKRADEVSIKATGTISIPSSFVAEHGFADMHFATLFFDKERKLVGVKPTANAREDGAITLSHRRRVASLRARAFFEHYGIPLAGTKRFPVTFDAELGMAVIPLGEIKRRPGRRKQR